jgi:phosphate transport system substrate-binding protein
MNMNLRTFKSVLVIGAILMLGGAAAQAQSYWTPGLTSGDTGYVQLAQAQSPNVPTGVLTGAGSTFAQPLYKEWNRAYFKGVEGFRYDGIGSGGGIYRFQNGAVDLGGSDIPMTSDQVQLTRGDNGDVVHLPAAYGGIVVTYNVPELDGQPLNLTGEQLAAIYLGQIRRWNDPRLLANNAPQLGKVNQAIIVFHRADASGTTAGFTAFLDENSADWAAASGAGLSVVWTLGWGKPNNDTIIDGVRGNPYSIGYADYNFVVAKKMPMASLCNPTGKFVAPSATSIAAAVTGTANASQGDDLRLKLINAPGAGSYPLVTATYMIFHLHQASNARAKTLRDFLVWAMTDGQGLSAPLNYVPVPDAVAQKATRLARSIDAVKQPSK